MVVKVTEQNIKLDKFLKRSGLVESGGQAKAFIQSGYVMVNGEIETRRGRKLIEGDRVTFNGETFPVTIPDKI
ncbi:RNA-binding protein [Limnospira fusiformis CCALA 023]|uniref:RNA-binding S4 domain-containing protein n=1 Tax=Arthrospira sp. PCC 8006 TaxID=1982224 RepID=UPI00396D7D55